MAKIKCVCSVPKIKSWSSCQNLKTRCNKDFDSADLGVNLANRSLNLGVMAPKAGFSGRIAKIGSPKVLDFEWTLFTEFSRSKGVVRVMLKNAHFLCKSRFCMEMGYFRVPVGRVHDPWCGVINPCSILFWL